MIGLAAGDFSAIEAACQHDLDALGAGAHGTADGVLHGAAEAGTLLQLLGDIFSHQLSGGIHFVALDFNDVELSRLADHLFHLLTQTFYFGCVLAQDHAGTGAVEVDADNGVVSFDLDTRHAGCVQGLFQEFTDLLVFHDQVADLLVAGVPARIPVFDDTHSETVGIHFLSHISLPPYSFSFTTTVMREVLLLMR